MSNQDLITNAIANMSNEEKATIFPPITRANFVVRKSWLGRNQIITFNTKATKTKPSVKVTYNHDEVLNLMLPKLNIMPCWIKHEGTGHSQQICRLTRDICQNVK